MKIQVMVIFVSSLMGISHIAFGANSLCESNENVYFSCSTKTGKILSLCGKVIDKDKYGKRVEFDDQWLQYRFGLPTKIELVYPRKKVNSITNFKAEIIRAQGGLAHIDAVIFVSGGIGYSVESVSPNTGEVIEGVSVGDPKNFSIESQVKRKDKYPKAQILCAEKANTDSFFDLVEYLSE